MIRSDIMRIHESKDPCGPNMEKQNMRTFRTYLLSTLLVGLAGCGGGGSDNGGLSSTGRDPAIGGQCQGRTGQTCTGQDAYVACYSKACGPQLAASFGSGSAKGDFTGGACADLMKCLLACPCDATAGACEVTCGQTYAMTGTCASSMLALSTCSQTAGCTVPACTGGTGTTATTSTGIGTGTATGGGCPALKACCATLTNATFITQCNAAVAAGEAVCGEILQVFQISGYCK